MTPSNSPLTEVTSLAVAAMVMGAFAGWPGCGRQRGMEAGWSQRRCAKLYPEACAGLVRARSIGSGNLQMRALIQRVSSASVMVEGRMTGEIGAGFLVLVCAMQGDTGAEADWLARKVVNLRIFEDDEGRMNR